MNLLTVVMAAQGAGDYSFLIMMVAIFAIMYFSSAEQEAEGNPELP